MTQDTDDFEEFLHITVDALRGEVQEERDREQPNGAHLRYMEGKLRQAYYTQQMYLRIVKGR